jgi:hypothetical protein
MRGIGFGRKIIARVFNYLRLIPNAAKSSIYNTNSDDGQPLAGADREAHDAADTVQFVIMGALEVVKPEN